MAHIMGMQVIAEGIETIKEFYTCKDIGADFMQGYLVQKPTLKVNEIKNIYTNIINIISEDKRNNPNARIDDEFIELIASLSINTSLYELFVHFKEATKNNFHCSQCSSPIEITKIFFTITYITCPSCQPKILLSQAPKPNNWNTLAEVWQSKELNIC